MPEPKEAYFKDVCSLAIQCPHADAVIPNGKRLFYRIIKSDTVDSNCFLPTDLREDRPLPDGFDDCIGKSVSVYDDLQAMINGFFKIQAGKKKNKTIKICQLLLCQKDGVLKQTFDNKNHHSWWRSQSFSVASATLKEIEI